MQRLAARQESDVLCQGTTSVVPKGFQKQSGFSR